MALGDKIEKGDLTKGVRSSKARSGHGKRNGRFFSFSY